MGKDGAPDGRRWVWSLYEVELLASKVHQRVPRKEHTVKCLVHDRRQIARSSWMAVCRQVMLKEADYLTLSISGGKGQCGLAASIPETGIGAALQE
jgi:hypothetical protein